MDGILIIDKPVGITSYQVVDTVKRITGSAKVGHGGTLDPLASGVLPVFLNKATRLAPFLMNGTKRYRATMHLGIETDTQDREGRVIAECSDVPSDPQVITQVVLSFAGEISQVPPMYSALKYHGTPLYKLARKGVCFDRTARIVRIYRIQTLHVRPPMVSFEVDCSPGTYIRTLCADIGQQLGCGAHLHALTRLGCGCLGLDDAVKYDEVNTLRERDVLSRKLVSLSRSFSHLPMVRISSADMTLLRTRKIIPMSQMKHAHRFSPEWAGLLQAGCDGECEIALVQSLVSHASLPSLSEHVIAWKRVCFYNPQENTIH